jgi:hypothetical protein
MEGWKYVATIRNIDTRLRWVVSFTARPLYPKGEKTNTDWIRGWVGPTAGLDAVELEK